MLSDTEIAFLRARLDEDEETARDARACAEVKDGRWFDGEDEINDDNGLRLATVNHPFVTAHIARHDPARVLREVAVWRRLLLDYSIPPGTDAKYGGTERETGFRLALSAALKAKIATYPGNPVTGEPFPPGLAGRIQDEPRASL